MNEENKSLIEGRRAVGEALSSGRSIERVYVLEHSAEKSLGSIVAKAKKSGAVVDFVSKERLERISETGKHQGIIAVVAAYEYSTVDEILSRAKRTGEDPFLILLDGICDPGNLGAIIRTACLAGAHGVIIPKRRAAGLTEAVVKASAGALNYMPVAKAGNMVSLIKELKKRGIWFVCGDMDGDLIYDKDLTGPVALVIGGEGSGVSRLVKENCDFVVSVPMKGEIASLNASVAAGVLLYEILRQRIK